MGASCSTQAGSDDDALLAAIRDGDDETVRKVRIYIFRYLATENMVSGGPSPLAAARDFLP